MLTWHDLVGKDPRVACPNITPHGQDVRHPAGVEGRAVEGTPEAADKQVRDVPHRCRLPQFTHAASADTSLDLNAARFEWGHTLGSLLMSLITMTPLKTLSASVVSDSSSSGTKLDKHDDRFASENFKIGRPRRGGSSVLTPRKNAGALVLLMCRPESQ